MIPYIEDTMADWDTLGVPYEVLDQDEIRYRWPAIGPEQEIGVGLHEPQAGVVRARRSIEAVAEVFRKEGGDVTLAGAELGERDGKVQGSSDQRAQLGRVNLIGQEVLSHLVRHLGERPAPQTLDGRGLHGW